MEKSHVPAAARESRDRRLGTAQHLQHQQRIALHGLLRRAADGCRNQRRRSSGPDWHTAPIDQPAKFARTISAQERTTPRISPFLSMCLGALAQTTGASALWGATPSADRPITITICPDQEHAVRSPPQRHRANGSAVSCRILQPLQHRQHGPAGQHAVGFRFRRNRRTAGTSRQIQLS